MVENIELDSQSLTSIRKIQKEKFLKTDQSSLIAVKAKNCLEFQ